MGAKIALVLLFLLCFALPYCVSGAENRRGNVRRGILDENLRARVARSPQITETDIEDALEDVKEDAQDSVTSILLPKGYNRLERPKITIKTRDIFQGLDPSIQKQLSGFLSKSHDVTQVDNSPTKVHIYMSIRNIIEIDEINEQVTLEFDYNITWFDNALAQTGFDKGVGDHFIRNGTAQDRNQQRPLDPSFLRKIWKPDIYIENLAEVTHPRLISRPASLKLGVLGVMTYIARATMKLHCDFDFKYYPADTQKCEVTLRSYSFDSRNLTLLWAKPEGVYLLDTSDDNFDLAIGNLRRFKFEESLKGNNETAEIFDALQFTVYARRQLSYQLLQTYIPSMLYVGITWLCFMIPRNMIEARMAAAMTTLLTLTAMFGSVRESTPVVSYIKAIDTWMAAAIVFVFGVLFEFCVLLWTESAKRRKEEETEPENKRNAGSFQEKLRDFILEVCTTIIEFIERHSFIIILIIFIIFNVWYWYWLLNSSGYFEWKVDEKHNAIEDDDDEGENSHIERIVEEFDPLG